VSAAAISVTDLRKSYGDFQALRGIGFDIREGEVFGLLGPNGAGKTTTLRLLCALIVASGEHLALVGATGAGKSTLAKLLVRAYDANEGRVRFGGVDLREAPLDDLRRRLVFVPQEGHLFSGTIAENISLAQPGASEGEVRDALRAIGALERFESLPEGLATDVRSRGVRLSSGERQLVSLRSRRDRQEDQ